MAYDLGPRALRIFDALRDRIVSGEWTPGTKLPAHTDLATMYGVAPLTVRQVLARLEREGLVLREQGRGTFVQEPRPPAVLIVEDEPHIGQLLGEHVKAVGARPIVVETTAAGLAALEAEAGIALVLSDVRVPATADGVAFIRAVRRRWPDLPLAAVTAYADDLAELHGTPECPILVLPKPFRAQQVREALRLVLRPLERAAT